MQLLIIVGSVAILAYLSHRYRKGINQELIIAFLVAFGWVNFSGIYNYRYENYWAFGINLFPLIAWTAGLVLLREIYERLKGNRILKASAIYVSALLALEYVGYNWGGDSVGI